MKYQYQINMTEEQKQQIIQLIKENIPDHSHIMDKVQHSDLLGVDPDGLHGNTYTPSDLNIIKKPYTAGEGITAGDATFIADGNESDTDMVEINDVSTQGEWGTTAIGYYAQSFQFEKAQEITKLVVRLGKQASPTDNVTVSIHADNGDKPALTDIGKETFDGSTLGALAEKTITLDATASISAGTKYWIKVKRDSALDDTDYYLLGHAASSSYADGVLKTSTDGTTWGTGTFGDDDSSFRFILEFTAGKTYLTRASDNDTAMAYGIAEDTVAPGSETDLITNGISTLQTGLTAGAAYYTSNTPGAIGTSVPAFGNYVGIALTATSLLLIIREAVADAGSSLAGDKLISSSDGNVGSTDDAYTKIRETEIVKDGTLRIKFSLHTNNASYATYGRIYRNGVAVGTERSSVQTSAEEFSEDIAGWTAGDLVQIYYHRTTANLSTVSNFRIYADKYEVATVII